MSVQAAYLEKIRRAVRRNSDTDVDAELADIIEECRADLESVGIIHEKAIDETDVLILGAVRSFARWKFGLSNEDADKNRDDYTIQKDELRRKRDYMGYVVTFSVTYSGDPVTGAVVEFHGESKHTNSLGAALFYYIANGTHQEYFVSANGYKSVDDYVDISGNTTVNVSLIAG